MEDDRSLLALKTLDYQKMSVANFNMKLLDWANENYEILNNYKKRAMFMSN